MLAVYRWGVEFYVKKPLQSPDFPVGRHYAAIGRQPQIKRRSQLKILIADDHELFLNVLEFILKSEFKDVDIVLAKNYTEIFTQLEKYKNFDLIVTDLAMPGANWLEALNRIHQFVGETPIIIVSAVFDKEILQKTLEVGVSGYIPKSSSNAVMLSAINLVRAGGVYIPHELLDNAVNNKEINQEIKTLQTLSDEHTTHKSAKKLTPRQIEVVKCIAKGLSNKLIAYELGLTEGTVKVHVTVILKILGVNNRTAAVMEAVKNGYISKEEVNL